MKADFAITLDPDKTAHNNEQSHLDLQCLPSSLKIFIIIQSERKLFFLNFADDKICRHNFVVCFLSSLRVLRL